MCMSLTEGVREGRREGGSHCGQFYLNVSPGQVYIHSNSPTRILCLFFSFLCQITCCHGSNPKHTGRVDSNRVACQVFFKQTVKLHSVMSVMSVMIALISVANEGLVLYLSASYSTYNKS